MYDPHNRTVLIVNRNPLLGRALSSNLATLRYESFNAQNNVEASAIVLNFKVKAIIYNLSEDIQGFVSYCESVARSDCDQIPVIVIAEHVDREMVLMLQKYRVRELLTRPFTVERLGQALERQINGDRLENNKRHGHILVVEDFTITAKSIETLLMSHGYPVVLARSAEQAYDLLLRTRPEIVLLDIGLPGMNGLEFVKLLRDKQMDIPFAVISGSNDPDVWSQVRKHGSLQNFPKPVDHTKLIGFLRGFLTREGIDSPSERPQCDYQILVAMGDERAGQVLCDALHANRITYKLANDGYQALAELALQPKIAVLDVVLRGLDGVELIRRMRNQHPNGWLTHIILLVEEIDDSVRQEVLEMGAQDALGKPIQINSFIAKVNALIGGEALITVEEYVQTFSDSIRRMPSPNSKHFFAEARRIGHDLLGSGVMFSDDLSKLGKQLEILAIQNDQNGVVTHIEKISTALSQLVRKSASSVR